MLWHAGEGGDLVKGRWEGGLEGKMEILNGGLIDGSWDE